MTSQLPPLEPGTVLLETGRPDDENRQSLLFRNPVETLKAHSSRAVEDLLHAIDDRLEQGFHVAGYLGYECGYAFEAFEEYADAERPIAWFGVFNEPELWPVFERDRWEPSPSTRISDVAFSWNRDAYGEAFRKTRQHLYEGDVYQINLTGKFQFSYEGSLEDLYRQLKQRQGVAFNALIVTESDVLISCSPELFFRREGRRIWTRPMKGTIGRGRTPAEDREHAETLAADPKSQAENLMIVDLLRNDLSRVAEQGSVKVSDLFTVERYETVIQMTSTVEAQLRADVGYADLFRALFPCGSVTGAPKIRAMQIIRDVEAGPRGVYTGTIGHAAPDGHATFNVAIRTLSLTGGRGEMGSGGGIVWDSTETSEYDECLLKARFLTADEPSFQLIETMGCTDGIERLDRHVDRLLASAGYFGFAVDPRVVLQRLDAVVSQKRDSERVRIRLLLSKDGSVSVESTEPDVIEGIPSVVLAATPVDSSDRFLYHKTTRRESYRLEFEKARAAGHFDALFVNERGEVTEGSRTNVYAKLEGRVMTPPVSSGLLAGTLRAELLESRKVVERVLSLDDLRNAEALYVSNSVIGLVEVRLASTERFERPHHT